MNFRDYPLLCKDMGGIALINFGDRLYLGKIFASVWMTKEQLPVIGEGYQPFRTD